MDRKKQESVAGKIPGTMDLRRAFFCIGEPFSYRFHVCRLQKKRGKIVLDRIEYKIDQDGMLRQIYNKKQNEANVYQGYC